MELPYSQKKTYLDVTQQLIRFQTYNVHQNIDVICFIRNLYMSSL